jgi:hypothetical protein
MTKEQGQLVVYDLTKQLQRATKYERAIKERTDQMQERFNSQKKTLKLLLPKEKILRRS